MFIIIGGVIVWIAGALFLGSVVARVIRHRDTEIPNGDKK